MDARQAMGTVLNRRIVELSRPLDPLPTGVAATLPRGERLRAVLFDVYGTLIISGSGDVGTASAVDSARAAEQALECAGYSREAFPNGEAVVDAYGAAVRAAQRERAQEVDHPEVEIRAVWGAVLDELGLSHDAERRERVAVEYECRVNPVWPMPGAADTLRILRERGTPTGIVSNSQFYTPLLFSALLGAGPEELGLEEAISCWSYRLRAGKPSTALYQQAADGLRSGHGIAPRECLYVGNDMLNDVWAASRVGFRTALFAGDRRSLRWRSEDPRCANLAPDAVVVELQQVLELLD